MYKTHSIVRAALETLGARDDDQTITQIQDIRLTCRVDSTMWYVVTGTCFRRMGSFARAALVKAETTGPNEADMTFTVYEETDARQAEALGYMQADSLRSGAIVLAGLEAGQ